MENTWLSFLDAVYDGGEKKVPNPNPETKRHWPRVTLDTALETPSFYAKIKKQYESWKQENSVSEVSSSDSSIPLAIKTDADVAEFNDLFNQDLSEDHIEALASYSGYLYTAINSHLRYGSALRVEDPEIDVGSVFRGLESFFKTGDAVVPRAVVVYRGIGEDHPLLKMLRGGTLVDGTEVTDSGYMSTTLFSQKAKAFGHNLPLLRITVPAGARGYYLGPKVSQFDNEKELLLNRGTKLRVTKVKANKIHLEVVLPDIMGSYKLEDTDRDEVGSFGKRVKRGKQTPDELFQKFLSKAKPETRARMKKMTALEFMELLGAIMGNRDA